MKKELTEALVFAAEGLSPHPISRHEFRPILAAARLVERLLPGECPCWCHLSGNEDDQDDHGCQECLNNSGQVWDEEIVQLVGKVTTDPRWAHIESPLLLEVALAVLKALAGLLEKGEG